MKIKKNSKIYKYLSFLDKVYEIKLTEHKSLCPLFWQTVLATLFLPLFGTIRTIISGLEKLDKMTNGKVGSVILTLLFICFGIVVIGVSYLMYLEPKLILVLLIGIGLYLLGFLLIFSIMKFYVYIQEKREINKPVNNSESKVDNSISEFITEGFSSIKNKVCPLIEFVDDDEH